MRPAINILTLNGASSFIRKAIESVYDYTDEILVFDTGSTDSTMKVLGEYEKVKAQQFDVQHLGKVWTNSKLDIELTRLLNQMKSETKSEWILKIDDDEFFPKELMEEIKNLEDAQPIYSIPFWHSGKEKSEKMVIKRLFLNIPEVEWNGIYGKETLAYNGKRIPSRKCPVLKNHFIHLGELRTDTDRKHNYEYV